MVTIYDGMTTYQKKALKNRLKIEWIYTSNALEGNTVSLGDTAFIVEEGLTVSGISLREHEEVVGHARAVDIVYELLAKNELLEEDIFRLHNAYYPHPRDMKHLMGLWFDEFRDISNQNLSLNESIKRYTRSHIGFTSIHPFFDGNGRLARLLANMTMLKNNYLPLIIDNKKRKIYIELLSKYNLSAEELNNKSESIIEENEEFEALYQFFQSEYQNSQTLLDEIKG